MVRTCVVCSVKYEPNSEIKFHSFPRDKLRKDQWKKACKIHLCLPSSKVCSRHFLPADYLLSGFLKRDAVPCKQNVSIKQENSTATITDTNIKHFSNHGLEESCLESQICVSPSKPNVSIKQENSTATISDTNIKHFSDNGLEESCLESQICVTPRKHKLDKDITSVQLSPLVCVTPKLSPSKKKCKLLNVNTIGQLSPTHFSTPDWPKDI